MWSLCEGSVDQRHRCDKRPRSWTTLVYKASCWKPFPRGCLETYMGTKRSRSPALFVAIAELR